MVPKVEVSACSCSREFKGETGLLDSAPGEFEEPSIDGLDTVRSAAFVGPGVEDEGVFADSRVLISTGVDAAGSLGCRVASSDGVMFCGSLFCTGASCPSRSLDAITAKVAQGGRSAMFSDSP